MWDFITKLLDTSDFQALWHCGTWTTGHGWMHILADVAIFAAFTTIPVVICAAFFRRRDVPYPPVFWGLVIFMLLCGMNSLISASLFWHPWYRLAGITKLATAIVAWGAVVALVRVMPTAMQLPGLARRNEELRGELAEQQRAESELRRRAAELERMNEDLESVSRLAVGREERIIELKREVNALLQRAGERPRYALRLEQEQLGGSGA